MRVDRLIYLIGLFAVAGLIYSITRGNKPQELPFLGNIPAFNLTQANGSGFDSQVLKGKIWIADLGFNGCKTVCQESSLNMAKLSRTFERVKNVALVSIAVEPGENSPADLINYAKRLKGRGNWFFLSGNKDYIHGLLPKIAPGSLVLVDHDLRVRGSYDGMKERDINRLFRDTVYLLAKK